MNMDETIAEGRRLLNKRQGGQLVPGSQTLRIGGEGGADSELIVWARKNLPALLTALDDAECESERLRGEWIIENRQRKAVEAALARVQSDLSRLMNDLHETASGLGRWHDETEYLEWAEKEIRHIWLRTKGLDDRGRPLDGDQ